MRRLQKLSRTVLVIAALSLLMFLSACKKKKEVTPTPQEQAPTISQPQPAEQPPAPPPPPPEQTPPAEEKPAVTAKPKPKPKKRAPVAKKTVPAKPAPAPKPAEPAKSKTVVEEGGANQQDQPLSAKLPKTEAMQQRKSTAQLQQETENNLRSITRTLTADEQAMVQHIRNYMQQSRAAENDGDTERAYNLAMKARLLSDELVKR
ncbi:MAG: hypothetical protein ACE14M_06730 [Terriglobales bacterium]